MNSAAVLMSTYNGEKYLREQLDSIFNQSDIQIELFVRDDGSSDNTKAILSEYAEKYENIHLNFAENVGVGNSFMNLLYSAPDNFDFYAFADQDDIWDSRKIAEAANMLNESGKLLYASNQECVDKDLNSLGLRYSEDCNLHLSPVSILEENMLAGCTMVLTNKFYKILSEETNRPSAELLHNRIHDVWVAMIASLYDGIIYDKRSFIKYRQHENNVVGADKGGLKKQIKEKIKKLRSPEHRNGRSKLAKEVVAKFAEEADKYELIKYCAQADTRKGKKQILKNQKQLRSYTGESYFGFRFKVIFGLF